MDKWVLPSNASDALKQLVAQESGSSASSFPSQLPKTQETTSPATSTTTPNNSQASLTTSDLSNKQSCFESRATLYSGKYCCVVGCSNSQGRDIARGIMFHKFPVNNKRRQLWIQAVKRGKSNKPSELWTPAKNTVICSEHFFGGRKCDTENSPAYVPSIFPTHHVKPKTFADDARFKRREKFQQMREKVISYSYMIFCTTLYLLCRFIEDDIETVQPIHFFFKFIVLLLRFSDGI